MTIYGILLHSTLSFVGCRHLSFSSIENNRISLLDTPKSSQVFWKMNIFTSFETVEVQPTMCVFHFGLGCFTGTIFKVFYKQFLRSTCKS